MPSPIVIIVLVVNALCWKLTSRTRNLGGRPCMGDLFHLVSDIAILYGRHEWFVHGYSKSILSLVFMLYSSGLIVVELFIGATFGRRPRICMADLFHLVSDYRNLYEGPEELLHSCSWYILSFILTKFGCFEGGRRPCCGDLRCCHDHLYWRLFFVIWATSKILMGDLMDIFLKWFFNHTQ